MSEIAQNLTPKKRKFLAAFSNLGSISHAAQIAGVSRRTHYDWMANDPAYPALFREAREEAGDVLEQEARRRAVEGVSKPVFYRGKVVGHIQEYSDTLLILLLKGAMPGKYRERFDARHSGLQGGPIPVGNVDDPDLARILIMLRASAEKAGRDAERQ